MNLCIHDKRFILLLLSLCLWGSCRKAENTPLEKALQLSGSHRQEWEKVLEHFSRNPEDSLKRKAAIFLIENMPGHKGPDSNSIRAYRSGLDTLSGLSFEERKVLLTFPSRYPDRFPQLRFVEDLHSLHAAEVIRHIERNCRLKDSCPWLQNVSFDTFCEYILPYRIGQELVEFSPDTPDQRLQEAVDYATRYYNDCRHSAHCLSTYLSREQLLLPDYSHPDSLLNAFLLREENQNQTALLRLRQLGVPVALDYLPIRKQEKEDPVWYVPLDPRLAPRSRYTMQNFHTGKVYRRTFSHQPLPVTDGNEFVPPFFRDPFRKDVTELYLHTADIRLTVNLPRQFRYVYLAMYDGNNWQPIAYSRVKKGECHFTKLGKDGIYLPVYYPDGQMQALTPPFILRSDAQLIPLTAPADSLTDLRLERLVAYKGINNYFNETLIQARFECADHKNFEHPDTVHIIQQSPYYKLHTIPIDYPKPQRYWRLRCSFSYTKLAELHFLNAAGEILRGQYSTPNSGSLTALTDQNPNTENFIPAWVCVDFGKPVQVSAIRYMATNDGYNVCSGHEYELFYDQNGKWLSAGTAQAIDDVVCFSHIPANRLYQLRDKTNGKKGEAFTWSQGRARFW